jgi:hypothetical protein
MTEAKSKRKKNKSTKGLNRMKSGLKKEELFRRKNLVGHIGKEKISEVVMRFIGPLIHESYTETQWKALIELALISWNASLLPLEERKATIDEHVREGIVLKPEEAKQAIYELIERKDRYFADYHQLLVSYDLTMTAKGPLLTVAFLSG